MVSTEVRCRCVGRELVRGAQRSAQTDDKQGANVCTLLFACDLDRRLDDWAHGARHGCLRRPLMSARSLAGAGSFHFLVFSQLQLTSP